MAERKDIDKASSDASATPDNTPAPASLRSDLPSVESPPLSPMAGEPAPVTGPEAIRIDPIADAPPLAPLDETPAVGTPAVEAPTTETASAPEVVPPALDEKPAPTSRPFALRARHKRYALLAASVTIAAALGVVIGALASGGFNSKPEAPRVDVAGLEERKAMQQSITRLSKEVTTLKANLDAANKTAHTQIAKLNDKLAERVKKEGAEVTGSISAPQTAASAPAPAEQPAAVPTPIPQPRPPQVASGAEPPPPPPSMRSSIVPGWWIREARDGYVYVESHGDIYQVVPGAPLPGLGPVEQIKRQDGRWVVVTPRGIIVSMRDRRYFESF